MPFHTLVEIEPVALIGPPGVDPGIDEGVVLIPVVLNVGVIEFLTGPGRNRSLNRFQTIAIPWDHVHHHLDVALVHIGEHLLGVAFEHLGIELE